MFLIDMWFDIWNDAPIIAICILVAILSQLGIVVIRFIQLFEKPQNNNPVEPTKQKPCPHCGYY